MTLRALITLLLLLFPLGVFAQTTAQNNGSTLVANVIEFNQSTNRLEARGNVEILQGEVIIRAQRVVYDGVRDQLIMDGPIYIINPDGTVFAAEFADLDGDLANGILRSARVVFDQQLQVAASEIRRTNARFTSFHQTIASSCRICSENPTPLWEIRARRIVHDSEDRQLHFENASFRALGVPIFYTPYLRLPDPTVERATGFLFPEFNSVGNIGLGIKLPYFIAINDYSDLTLTPWITDQGSQSLEFRYRKNYRKADIQIDGAITNDNIQDLGLSGYLFAEGNFELPRGFQGKFDVELVSDPGYLLLYGYSEKDRLDSAVSVFRVKRHELITAELIHYRSLRDADNNRTTPTIVGDAVYNRRFSPNYLGGTASLQWELHGHVRRETNDPTDSGLARDVSRISGQLDWRKDHITYNGMQLAVDTRLRVDGYGVSQDDRLEFGNTFDAVPYAAVEWRWPLAKRTGKARHLIEPVAQLAWSDASNRDVANEDSLLVEFDENNLFEFSRYPGVDAQESGTRLNLGVSYHIENFDGWSLGLTVGRVFRDENPNTFGVSTGLTGVSSDWLVAAQFELGDRLDIINRSLFNEDFDWSRNEMRLSWTEDDFQIASSYVWLAADAAEDRPVSTSEIAFNGSYDFSDHWTISGDFRYDFVTEEMQRTGLGLQYQNECATVDLSVSRRFTSSASVDASTEINLSFQLAGFGRKNSEARGFARQCRG